MGDNIEAFIAGYSPNDMPIAVENITEIKTHWREMTDGHSGTILAILTASSDGRVFHKNFSMFDNRFDEKG